MVLNVLTSLWPFWWIKVTFLPPLCFCSFRCSSLWASSWAASSWSSCPFGRLRSSVWSAAALFSQASLPTSLATSGRNPMWSRRCWVSETFVFPQSDLLYLLGQGWSSIYYSLFWNNPRLDAVHTVGSRDRTRDDEMMFEPISEKPAFDMQ